MDISQGLRVFDSYGALAPPPPTLSPPGSDIPTRRFIATRGSKRTAGRWPLSRDAASILWRISATPQEVDCSILWLLFFRLNVKRRDVTTVSVWYLIWENMIIHDSCPSIRLLDYMDWISSSCPERSSWFRLSFHIFFWTCSLLRFLISFCYMFSFYDTIH